MSMGDPKQSSRKIDGNREGAIPEYQEEDFEFSVENDINVDRDEYVEEDY
jgi:hypothetical protein